MFRTRDLLLSYGCGFVVGAIATVGWVAYLEYDARTGPTSVGLTPVTRPLMSADAWVEGTFVGVVAGGISVCHCLCALALFQRDPKGASGKQLARRRET